MNLNTLCPNCMSGTVSGGVCTSCGKSVSEAVSSRNNNALPLGYMLRNTRYYLGKMLGAGGFGITYLAWDQKANRCVALKELFAPSYVTREKGSSQVRVIPGNEADFNHLKVRFYQEAESQYKLSGYPEILKIYDYFEENGTAYFAMEFLKGQTMKKMLQSRGPQSWANLQPLVWQILNVLHLVHGMGLIHRDISPDNVFLLESGECKLIDFGSARSFTQKRQFTQYLNRNFAPYEQWDLNGNQGPWTDVYALCATIYFAMSGKLPIMACDRITKVRAFHEADPNPPIQKLNPTVPPHVAAALSRGMALQVEQRYPSVAALARDLFPGTPFPGKVKAQSASVPVLRCERGMRQGREDQLKVGRSVVLGRGSGNDIAYPDHAKNISHHHCELYVDDKMNVLVRDVSSYNQTYINGERLQPGAWRPFRKGQILTVATDVYRLR